jgi:hypothetical protein
MRFFVAMLGFVGGSGVPREEWMARLRSRKVEPEVERRAAAFSPLLWADTRGLRTRIELWDFVLPNIYAKYDAQSTAA